MPVRSVYEEPRFVPQKGSAPMASEVRDRGRAKGGADSAKSQHKTQIFFHKTSKHMSKKELR